MCIAVVLRGDAHCLRIAEEQAKSDRAQKLVPFFARNAELTGRLCAVVEGIAVFFTADFTNRAHKIACRSALMLITMISAFGADAVLAGMLFLWNDYRIAIDADFFVCSCEQSPNLAVGMIVRVQRAVCFFANLAHGKRMTACLSAGVGSLCIDRFAAGAPIPMLGFIALQNGEIMPHALRRLDIFHHLRREIGVYKGRRIGRKLVKNAGALLRYRDNRRDAFGLNMVCISLTDALCRAFRAAPGVFCLFPVVARCGDRLAVLCNSLSAGFAIGVSRVARYRAGRFRIPAHLRVTGVIFGIRFAVLLSADSAGRPLRTGGDAADVVGIHRDGDLFFGAAVLGKNRINLVAAVCAQCILPLLVRRQRAAVRRHGGGMLHRKGNAAAIGPAVFNALKYDRSRQHGMVVALIEHNLGFRFLQRGIQRFAHRAVLELPGSFARGCRAFRIIFRSNRFAGIYITVIVAVDNRGAAAVLSAHAADAVYTAHLAKIKAADDSGVLHGIAVHAADSVTAAGNIARVIAADDFAVAAVAAYAADLLHTVYRAGIITARNLTVSAHYSAHAACIVAR